MKGSGVGRNMAATISRAARGPLAAAWFAGAIAPLVMHSTLALAIASFLMMNVGLVAWLWVRRRLQ